VGNTEATEAKIDALRDRVEETKQDVRELRVEVRSVRDSLDETKQDVRELRVEVHSTRDKIDKLRDEMHAGFAALRESIVGTQSGVQTSITSLQANVTNLQASIAELRATMKTAFWAVSVVGMLSMIFFTAGKALHWF